MNTYSRREVCPFSVVCSITVCFCLLSHYSRFWVTTLTSSADMVHFWSFSSLEASAEKKVFPRHLPKSLFLEPAVKVVVEDTTAGYFDLHQNSSCSCLSSPGDGQKLDFLRWILSLKRLRNSFLLIKIIFKMLHWTKSWLNLLKEINTSKLQYLSLRSCQTIHEHLLEQTIFDTKTLRLNLDATED